MNIVRFAIDGDPYEVPVEPARTLVDDLKAAVENAPAWVTVPTLRGGEFEVLITPTSRIVIEHSRGRSALPAAPRLA